MGKTSFYLSVEKEKTLRLTEDRGISRAVNEIIHRYAMIMDSQKRILENMFTAEEWDFLEIAGFNNTWANNGMSSRPMLVAARDNINLSAKYADIKKVLMYKINNLTTSQDIALAEMVESRLE